MKINKIYIGVWFQRTMLHLTEIYDFLRDGTSRLNLNPEKLLDFRKKLNLGKIDYFSDGLEYISFSTGNNISVKIFEDGLMSLSNNEITENTLFSDIDELTDYYENCLSPAIGYLFSLGSPVPKELANIANVYPYFIVLDNVTKDELLDLMSRTEKQKYFEFDNDNYDVIRGDKYYFINNKTQ